jgi:hypothetical protein
MTDDTNPTPISTEAANSANPALVTPLSPTAQAPGASPTPTVLGGTLADPTGAANTDIRQPSPAELVSIELDPLDAKRLLAILHAHRTDPAAPAADDLITHIQAALDAVPM